MDESETGEGAAKPLFSPVDGGKVRAAIPAAIRRRHFDEPDEDKGAEGQNRNHAGCQHGEIVVIDMLEIDEFEPFTHSRTPLTNSRILRLYAKAFALQFLHRQAGRLLFKPI
jgi:hypothetical protein